MITSRPLCFLVILSPSTCLSVAKNLVFYRLRMTLRPFDLLRACPEYLEGLTQTSRHFFAAIPFWIAFTTPSLPDSLILSSMPFFS